VRREEGFGEVRGEGRCESLLEGVWYGFVIIEAAVDEVEDLRDWSSSS